MQLQQFSSGPYAITSILREPSRTHQIAKQTTKANNSLGENSGDRSARAPRKTAVRDGRAGGAAVRGSAGGCRAAAGALPPRGLPPGPYRLLRLPPSPPALTVPVSPSLPTLASARMLMSCAWLRHLASAGCGSCSTPMACFKSRATDA